ncbi:MAG TPA: hypothetical protein VLJ17_24815 [Xanthobacteraceae bacterium]|nr:hypothetical protein [Xanthobacteraceae bacterium]
MAQNLTLPCYSVAPNICQPISTAFGLPVNIVSGTVTASFAGFAPNGNTATLAVTNSSSNVALPAGGGTTIVVYNSGATAATVKLGTSSGVTVTTTTGDVIQAGAAQQYTIGSNTFLAAITASSTTTLVISGGSGLATGWGGASSGGAGGAVTIASGGVASGAYASGSIASGAMVDLGSQADAVCGSDTGSCSLIALIKRNNVVTDSAIPAGGNTIGKVDILGNVGGVMDFAGQNATAPASALQVGCEFNTTPTTISSGNASPCQLDSAGNLLVNLKTAIPTGSNGIGTVNPTTAANWGIVATGAAPPANAVYLGANASGATGGHVAALIACDSHVFKHITTATDTLAVQGVASQTIRICGWRSRAAGVATWFLENTASANANCASTLTQITGLATEAANTGETMLAPFWTGLANTSGNGLCINSTGTGGVDVDIWYTQF